MGVPALFAWLTRKYPSIAQKCVEERHVVNGTPIPADISKPNPNGFEADHLYLDMNGIIHPCCHPESGEEVKDEADMFRAIFNYIDRLVSIVRPRRLLYLAVDGPAPRAKMNQQRARRFRSGQEIREKLETIEKRRTELEGQGKRLPQQLLGEGKEPFDSNCITPGTPFMQRLSAHLEYYVLLRLSRAEPGWTGLKVVLSDASVPGEGEHKIMDFIREQRAAVGHNPNMHHVMYGADADLIMLGLVSHEPNFHVIREQFKPPGKSPCALCGYRGHKVAQCPGLPEDEAAVESQRGGKGGRGTAESARFIWVHLSALRWHIERELWTSPGRPPRWLGERLVDDWVFLCFLVGNDFLPHLPSLRIREGAIDRLVTIYRTLPGGGGDALFLHRDGAICAERLELFLEAVGKVEDEIFQDRRKASRKESSEREKRRLAKLSGKLTAHQHHTLKHGKDVDIATIYMSTLAEADPSAGDTNEAPRTPEISLGHSHAPKWALPLDDIDTSGLTEEAVTLEPISAGITLRKEELSDEAKEWLARKRQREQTRSTSIPHDTRIDTAATLPAPLIPPQGQERGLAGDSVGMDDDSEQNDNVGSSLESDGETNDDVRLWEAGWKDRYYLAKFQQPSTNVTFKTSITREYTRGLSWVLQYYYQGVPSWEWYYPYHYAPFASDCSGIVSSDLIFEDRGEPFLPLTQLMAVFPPDSASHLPTEYAALMTSPDSPLKHFYPRHFETDLNGFRFAWQGVTLLPFVDADLLQQVLRGIDSKLTPEELARNRLSQPRIYTGKGPASDELKSLSTGISISTSPDKWFGIRGTLSDARLIKYVEPPGPRFGRIKPKLRTACFISTPLQGRHTSVALEGTVWPERERRKRKKKPVPKPSSPSDGGTVQSTNNVSAKAAVHSLATGNKKHELLTGSQPKSTPQQASVATEATTKTTIKRKPWRSGGARPPIAGSKSGAPISAFAMTAQSSARKRQGSSMTRVATKQKKKK